jgi:uncharacterized membrane protein
MPHVMSSVFWILTTMTFVVMIDRIVLWLVPRVISARAVAIVRRRAGGINRLYFHGLNTPTNCRTPMATADALMTLCPYDVSDAPLRLSVTIPEDTYWSICCYGPNSDNVFAMNDLQAIQNIGRHAVFVLHTNTMNVALASNEFPVSLKSHRGIVLIRTVVPDPLCNKSLERLVANQLAATCDQSASPKVFSNS